MAKRALAVGITTAAAVAASVVHGPTAASAQPTGPKFVRVVCDARNSGVALTGCVAARAVRVEGGPASGVADADAAYEQVGRVMDFYARLVPGGVGSLIGAPGRDGSPAAIRITVRACSFFQACPMVNAFWSQGEHAMFLGAGFSRAFDVIAHELTHGVTAATSRLVYSGESGAINESMSDVLAELAEQTEFGLHSAWVMGEDLHVPGVPNPIRDLADPTRPLAGPGTGQPDRMGSPLYKRAKACSDLNDYCFVHRNSGVGNKTAYLIAVGGTFSGLRIVGIGVAKASKLYWSVENRLGPRASYATLGRTLLTACNALRRDVKLTQRFTAGDCATVKQAARATGIVA